MHTNCLAIAKVTKNVKLQTLRLVVTFDLSGKVTQRNAAYTSGDICGIDDERKDYFIEQAVNRAKVQLGTENFEMR